MKIPELFAVLYTLEAVCGTLFRLISLSRSFVVIKNRNTSAIHRVIFSHFTDVRIKVSCYDDNRY